MNELAHRLASLREGFKPEWDEPRRERVQRGVAKLQRRRHTRIVAASTTCTVCLVLGLGYLSRSAIEPWQTTQAPSARSQPDRAPADDLEANAAEGAAPAALAHSRVRTGAPTRLSDGSQVSMASPDSELFIEVDRPEHIRLRLTAGAAKFDVVPNRQRTFSVVAGAIEVEVIGTSFDVERSDNRARVAVSHGKVRVHGPAGDAYVSTGEARWFDDSVEQLSEAKPAAISGHRTAAAKHDTVRKPPARKEQAHLEWRALNQSGDYQAAYRLLEQGAVVDDDTEALMEAADIARLTDHLGMAVGYLRKVLSDHRRDPATPMAAFMLGRLLLDRLGRPSEAAEAFAVTRELAPESSLTQDALAREVEAWSKAGRPEEAYARARLFTERYPKSRRLRMVELYGGLRAP